MSSVTPSRSAREPWLVKHPAEWRQIGIITTYMALLFSMYFVPWCRNPLFFCAACYFSFLNTVVLHNHLHQGVFKSRGLNMAWRTVLSFGALYPASANVPSHNLVHHHFDDDGQPDWAAPEHVGFRWNLLTLLPGGMFYRDGQPSASGPADGSGLFLRTRPTAAYPHGLRVAGKAPPGCLVSQVGQQLEVLTGGRFLATPHVITAPGETGWARTSLAHFIHLRGDVAVAPLDRFVDEAGDRYAPPVLAGTYGMKTLIDIGLAPRSELDKLGYRAYDRLANIRAVEDQG